MILEPVSLTKRAADEIRIIMGSDEIPDGHSLRIGVSEGGCGTGGFRIGFDTRKEGDIEYIQHGIQIFVDKKHVMYLLGKQVNYHEEGDEWGFVFEDPDELKKGV